MGVMDHEPSVAEVVNTLRQARALIEVPERWTQTYVAVDSTGFPCSPLASEALCWCALGAVERIAGHDGDLHLRVSDLLRAHTPDNSVASFNDSHSHSEVLALFDAAIKAA
jgi:hypothetical protein